MAFGRRRHYSDALRGNKIKNDIYILFYETFFENGYYGFQVDEMFATKNLEEMKKKIKSKI